MRDLLIIVADGNMEKAFKGFFGRPEVCSILQCSPFEIDAMGADDILPAVGLHDPGLYARAHELLLPRAGQWRHAVVAMDAEWDGCPKRRDGSPDADDMRRRLEHHLSQAGWAPPDGLALVVEPEADNWLWSDSPHTAKALDWPSWALLRAELETHGWLMPGQTKPSRPKEAAEFALSRRRKPRSSAIYREVASKLSIRRCQDPAIMALVETLQRWFPVGGAE